MDQKDYNRKLSAILSADVKGYSLLMRSDEEATVRTLTKYRTIIAGLVEKYQGRIVDSPGDNILAEFASVVHSVQCGFDIQTSLQTENAKLPKDRRMLFRIGINLGDVIQDGERIYGDGVNVAARMESLADAGSICVSGSAYDQIENKIAFACEYLGEQTVKNITTPIRTYRLTSDESGQGCSVGIQVRKSSNRLILAVVFGLLMFTVGGFVVWNIYPGHVTGPMAPASVEKMAFPLPDKPSIAVLPFVNMSGDTEQAYFSDGVTEDIITDLSKISGLFVVARNSSFAYKGKPVKVRQVAEELGVRYVLEGSVRRAEEKIRITAQLIDALKGNHIWAERFDRDLKDVFSVQSEVARQVAKALAVTLKANENERLFQKYTTNIDAYEVFLRARWTVDAPSKENILRGEELFGRVIELDPNFAGGYAGLSFNLSAQVRFQYSKSPSADLARAFDLAKKAIEVDRGFAWGHIALGGAYLADGDPDAAVSAVREALTLEPSGYEANLFMGFYLQFAGESALAVEHLQLAKRLSPVESVRDMAFLALAQFMNGNYTETVRIHKEMSRKFPRSINPVFSVVLAAAYTLLESPEEAAVVAKKLLETHPNFNLSQWKYLSSWKSEENRTRLYKAAKKAGVPEFPKDK